MGYDFHSVRRDNIRTFRLSDAELAVFLSAKARRGFEYDNHYVRDLLFKDGQVMGDPEAVEASFAEQSPQKSMILVPVPRSWENLFAQLCEMVHAGVITAPNDVPRWALELVACPLVPREAAPEIHDEPTPVSESVPKVMSRRAAIKTTGNRVVGHLTPPHRNIAICGVRIAETNLAEGSYWPCRNCARMADAAHGVAA